MKKYTAENIKVIKSDANLEELIDISMESFARNLNEAACLARDFTSGFILEELPEEMVYLVCLGSSYDGNTLDEEEVTFPEDYEERQRQCSTQSEVVQLLWRDGKVPEWINVQVYRQDKTYTHIQLLCCGRFSSDKAHIYHAREGRAPFHVVGPALPIDYEQGVKFSLYWRENT